MKISITISILILVAAATMGWKNQQRIQVITKIHRSLVNEAAALKLNIDFKNLKAVPVVTKRVREEKVEQARMMAKELIAFALESEASQESGEQEDEAFSAKHMDIMEKMLSLDADQLKILIEEFRVNKEMQDQTRMGMISFAILTFASEHPKAALTMFTENQDMIDNEFLGTYVLSSSLEKWASNDPDGALEWIRQNAEKHPDLITDNIKAGLVKGAASNGISLGFELLDELKLENPSDAIGGLASAVKSPEERTEFLNLYREYLKNAPKTTDQFSMGAMHFLADGIGKDGFEAGSRWIAENNLTQDEMQTLVGSIGYNSKSSEKGLWIEWMGEKLSGEDRDHQIASIVENWTKSDFRSAGEWLAEAPEGPGKIASVAAYARTVAPHDQRVAAQWALTLPQGEKRKETLNFVYENWLQDEAANKEERDAFIADNPVE